MALFNRELNELADHIGRSDLRIYLHTAAPTEASPANGRVVSGGGLFQNGAVLAAAQISNAAAGDIRNLVAVPYNAAVGNVGTITHWSAYRGSDPVAYFPFEVATTINDGDTFTINANSLIFDGSTGSA